MDIRIDTLHLQVGGMDQDTARQFARLVAERLGAALAAWSSAPGPRLADTGLAAPAGPAMGPDADGPGPERIGSLRVAVQARAWDSPDSLAAHLAAEVSSALRSASMPAAGWTAPTAPRAPAGWAAPPARRSEGDRGGEAMT
jgi:hypothetical protein